MHKAEITITICIETPRSAKASTLDRNARILHHRATRDISKLARIVHSRYHLRRWADDG